MTVHQTGHDGGTILPVSGAVYPDLGKQRNGSGAMYARRTVQEGAGGHDAPWSWSF